MLCNVCMYVRLFGMYIISCKYVCLVIYAFVYLFIYI